MLTKPTLLLLSLPGQGREDNETLMGQDQDSERERSLINCHRRQNRFNLINLIYYQSKSEDSNEKQNQIVILLTSTSPFFLALVSLPVSLPPPLRRGAWGMGVVVSLLHHMTYCFCYSFLLTSCSQKWWNHHPMKCSKMSGHGTWRYGSLVSMAVLG